MNLGYDSRNRRLRPSTDDLTEHARGRIVGDQPAFRSRLRWMHRLLVLLAVVALLAGACSGSDAGIVLADDASVDDAGSSRASPGGRSRNRTGRNPNRQRSRCRTRTGCSIVRFLRGRPPDRNVRGGQRTQRYRRHGAPGLGIVDERFWGVFDADRVSLLASAPRW